MKRNVTPSPEQQAPQPAHRRHALLRLCLAAAGFLLLALALYFFIGRPMIRFVGDTGRFRAWIDSHGIYGRLAFLGMMCLQIIVAFIPGEPLEIAAGYAFGAVEGTLLCMLGTLIGGTAVFLFVRRFGAPLVNAFFPMERIERMRFLRDRRRLNFTIFLLFLIPGTPKDLLTYCAGLTKLPLSLWLVITSLARLPSIITSTLGGSALGMQNYTFAAIVFAAAIGISLIGLLVYRRIEACRPAKAAQEEEAQAREKSA